MELTFNKENNSWYVDLPSWEESKADLQMVDGADRMLDELSYNPKANKSNSVKLNISLDKKGDYNLTLLEKLEEGFGAYYTCDKLSYRIWLCDVTKFVFGEFPKSIGLTKV